MGRLHRTESRKGVIISENNREDMANEQNLKPFKKGVSGNPKGKPKGTLSLITKLRQALDKIHEGTQEPYHELLIKSMMKDGIKTDGQSRRLILQYLEGMPVNKTDITSDGKPLQVILSSEIINREKYNDTTSSSTTETS